MSRKQDKARAIAELLKFLKPGDTVTTTVLHVSRSGMSRSIMCQAVRTDCDGTPYISDISYLVADAIGSRVDAHGGVVMGGCGMNMCFAVVYSLGRALFPEGFGILGRHPVTGHKGRAKTAKSAARMVRNGWQFRGRNGDASGWDTDGGYSLGYR